MYEYYDFTDGGGVFYSALIGSLAFSLFITLAFCVVTLVFQWKMLEKAGEKGWKILIPFYADYTLFDKFWNKKWFWPYLVISVGVMGSLPGLVINLYNVVETEGNYAILASLLVSLCVLILSTMLLVICVLFYVHLADSFGYNKAFAVGLVFLPQVFLGIIAFGKHKYQGVGRQEVGAEEERSAKEIFEENQYGDNE